MHMKKSRLALALTTLSSIALLSGCGNVVTRSKDGLILSFTGADGQRIDYTADELFSGYKTDADTITKYYSAIYEVLVRNLFEGNSMALKKDELYKKAEKKVSSAEETAKSNAKTNGTSYDTEIQAIYDSYSVENKSELLEYFAYKEMETEVKSEFYDASADWTKTGVDGLSNTWKDLTDDYLSEELPFHVKHILVKLNTSSTNGYTASLTEGEATKLAGVVTRLATRKGGDTFNNLALEQSDDSGSQTASGDLGIMDKDTSYVNEFKLGVYAYETLFNQVTSVSTSAATKSLLVPEDVQAKMEAIGLGEIPYEAALKIKDYATITKDANGDTYNDGDAAYYPRNVYFNKYFNRHNISVITPNSVDSANEVGTPNATYEAMSGFQSVPELGGKKVLCDENGNVILVTKANFSGDSYEGVHFIVVQRNALIPVQNGVSLEDYYTTAIPGDSDYPVDNSNDPLDTYVNYMTTERSTYQTRANTVTDKIKNFDSNVDYRIYNQLLTYENVEIYDETLSQSLNDYINMQIASSKISDTQSFEQTWNSWIEQLDELEYLRENRLVSESCAISFVNSDSAAFAEGGACYVKK